MSSIARLANIVNSIKSTGPITDHGKERSRLNALKHGFTAQTIILPNEDAFAYMALCKQFETHYHPADITERGLVQRIADSNWRLGRFMALSENVYAYGHLTGETQVLMKDAKLHAAANSANVLKKNVPSLEAVSRAISRENRDLDKITLALESKQALRKTREKDEMEAAAAIRAHMKSQDKPFIPMEFGFVFTIEKIDAYLFRENALIAARNYLKIEARD